MWILIILITIIILLLYYLNKKQFNYWNNKGMRYVKEPKPLVGSLWPMMSLKEHFMIFYDHLYKTMDNEKYFGFYQCYRPALFIKDPNLIKQIFIKDFDYFTDHGFKIHEDADPMQAKNLFNMEGQKWKEMRAKLTPTFTTGKIKAMFPLISDCCNKLEKHLQLVSDNNIPVEMKDLCALFTTDVIASCAFGIETNSLENPNNYFRKLGINLVKLDFISKLKVLIIAFFPKLAFSLKLSFVKPEINNEFRNIIHEVMEERNRTKIKRNDFLQLLLEIKEDKDIETNNNIINCKWTDDDITAQAVVFFIGGFETTSTLMSFALLELAMNPDIQYKLQDEIDEILDKYNNEISHTAIQELKYLELVIQETLRKYPPTGVLFRECTKNYQLPDSDIIIESGTPVLIPLYSLQNDPKYFDNPEEFNPDRFNNNNNQHMKFIYMPFGEGPRQCIGNRFALLQSKLGLFTILKDFKVVPCVRTSYPVEFDPEDNFLTSKNGIWLKFINRNI